MQQFLIPLFPWVCTYVHVCRPDNCFSKTALKLDLKTKRWKKLPALPTGRPAVTCGLVSKDGNPKRIVVAGGFSPTWKAIDTVEVLELATLTWSKGTDIRIILNQYPRGNS